MGVKKLLAENLVVVKKVESKLVVAMRKGVCSGCPYNDDGSCLKCGCILEVKWNSLTNRTLNSLGLPIGPIRITHCPLGKWGDKEEANHYRKEDGKPLLV